MITIKLGERIAQEQNRNGPLWRVVDVISGMYSEGERIAQEQNRNGPLWRVVDVISGMYSEGWSFFLTGTDFLVWSSISRVFTFVWQIQIHYSAIPYSNSLFCYSLFKFTILLFFILSTYFIMHYVNQDLKLCVLCCGGNDRHVNLFQ